MMGKNKMLIIGWDGATFDIIKPLVEQGEMPNMASLMKCGVWGRLESTVPPLTPVAWTSISTGVNPGKHGIFDAMICSNEGHKVRFANATMRKVKTLWSIMSERGRSVGVMNIPLTYPPDEVNGFVISGMFTPYGVSDFIYPIEIKAEIEKKFGEYMIECNQTDNPSVYLKLILDMVDFRERVALYLMENQLWDLFFAVFVASDRVQHFFWKYLDPSHPEHNQYGDAIAKVYKRMDQALGKMIAMAGPDVNVMMVSDHGFGPLKSAFFLNSWLIKNGYLLLKGDIAHALKIKKPSLLRRGVVNLAKKTLPVALWKKIRPGNDKHIERINVFSSLVDREKTSAFTEGVSGGIYINPDVVKYERYEELRGSIIKGLSELKDNSGEKVVHSVYRREDVYSGGEVNSAPDLIVICSPGYQIITPNEFLFFKKEYEDAMFLSHRWSGRHEQYGILLLKGNGIRKNIEINNARIIDVAPTALYLMNEDIPDYMDGRVMEAAIEDDYFRNNPAGYAGNMMSQENVEKELTEEQEKEIAERLKGLGYIE